MDKKNVTFSRVVPCGSSLPENGAGCPPPAPCAVGSDVDALVLHRL